MYTFKNLDQALIGMSQTLLDQGMWRGVRGFSCLEIPHPVTIEITNPCDRYVTIEQRKWNKFLPFVESLWMALGLNDLDSLPGRYVRNLYNFSDNGRTWRGGYGPRIRAFSGNHMDYDISEPNYRHIYVGSIKLVDQLSYIIQALQRDINTRQAIIEIGDPVKDDFDEHNQLKETKDYPCTRSLQFMMVDGKLNLTIYIRSNDILWGFSAVNVTNFCILQEYVANILGVPVGKYYHIANNFHLYEEHLDRIKEFANLDPEDYNRELVWWYPQQFKSLENFDTLINNLYSYEKFLYNGEVDATEPVSFKNEMIDDWSKVFQQFKDPDADIEFSNPYLNYLFS